MTSITQIDNPAIFKNVNNDSEIYVTGSRGQLHAGFDGNTHPETGEPTFWLDISYISSDNQNVSWHKKGYRFSTICCFCAAVCLGEEALNPQLIRGINEQCKMQYPQGSQSLH